MNKKVFRIFFVLLAISATGCGYAFTGSGTILPPDVRKIYIPTVENSSTQLGLGDILTESLRDQFDSYGVITVVERQSEADAVLRGRILQVTRRTQTATSSTNTSQQLETTVKVSLELARVTGPILWRDPAMSVSRSYGTNSAVVVTSSSDFASSTLSAAGVQNLDSREVARSQEATIFNTLSDDISNKVYDQAVAPDF